MEYINNTNLSYLWSKIKTYIDNLVNTVFNNLVPDKFGDTVALTDNIIDLSLGDVFTKTITSNTTFTIVGVPQNKNCTFSIILQNGGAYNIVWPSNVKWSYGLSPILSTEGIDVITFITPSGGNIWYGSLSLADAA